MPPALFYLTAIALAIKSFFVVPNKCKDLFFPISVKNDIGILIGLALEVALDTMDLLTTAILLIQEVKDVPLY